MLQFSKKPDSEGEKRQVGGRANLGEESSLMSNELLPQQPEQQHGESAATLPQKRGAHPWAQPFGKSGERVIRSGKGWSVRVIHFPTGPAVVDAEGPMEETSQAEYERLLRLGFRPEQATALVVMKSYQQAEGDCAERKRQRRRLAYARYLVESGRLSDGVIAPTPARQA
jgi:hypothetical protein